MKASILGGFTLTIAMGVVRGDCDTLKSISLPLEGDTTVTMPTGYQACDIPERYELEEFEIEGGVLTITGPSEATFANLRFTVMDGGGLIFDFDTTQFGPNFDYEYEDSYGYTMVRVEEGGYVEFTGKVLATGVENYWSVFQNRGTMEFKSDARFVDCGTNVFRSNYGKLRFRGDATFENNPYLGIENDGGTVRIAGDSIFNDTGNGFEGAEGAAFHNDDDSIAIFDGVATFVDNYSDNDGGAVFNSGKMKFYNKARFYNNKAGYGYDGVSGGAVYNEGTLKFFGAVQMIGNTGDYGGGLGVGGGGYVRFSRWTTITANNATFSGGAMSITDASDGGGSVVEFKRPSKVRITGNRKTGSDVGCNNIALEESSELIGYESDGDICDAS